MQTEDTVADIWLPAGHIQRIVEPAVATVVGRAHSLARSAAGSTPFFTWAAETGNDLLAAVRQATVNRAMWEQVHLRLDADTLGLLAYSLNALRSEAERGSVADPLQRQLLDQTRRSIWHSLPETTGIVCFLPRGAISEFLLPRLQLMSSPTVERLLVEPAPDHRWADDLVVRLRRALDDEEDFSELVRLQAPLSSLARLHDLLTRSRWESWDPVTQIDEIRHALARVLDPLVLQRAGRATGAESWRAASPAPGRPETIPPRGQLPPHGQRFLASVLDSVLAFVGAMVAAFSLGMAGLMADPSISDATLETLVLVAAYPAYFGYYVFTTAFLSGTPGKLLLGLRVVDERGERPGLARAVGRYLVMFVLSFLAFTWWWVLFRRDRRALHDLATGLWVVYEAPNSSNRAA